MIGSTKQEKIEATRPAVQWNRESFIGALRDRCGAEVVAIAEAIAERVGCCPVSWWGNGRVDGSWSFAVLQNGAKYPPFSLWTSGVIQLQFGTLQARGVSAELIATLPTALNQIPGIQIPNRALNRFPMFKISLLKDSEMLARFAQAIEVFVAQIRTTPKAGATTTSN